jgi:hypothetical protein
MRNIRHISFNGSDPVYRRNAYEEDILPIDTFGRKVSRFFSSAASGVGGLVKILFVIALVLGCLALGPWLLEHAWNYVIVDEFHQNNLHISFWGSVCVLVVLGVLGSAFRGTTTRSSS